MSRFSYLNGKLVVDCEDGDIPPEEATACVLFEMLVALNEIDERLKGIEHSLEHGKLKVHRVD